MDSDPHHDSDELGGEAFNQDDYRDLHPSLAEQYELGPDIYDNLMSWVFGDERFQYWQTSDRLKENWLLRCSGTPGSGKVFSVTRLTPLIHILE
jgi:hypothetical protein